jgi:hypothetical protein
MIIRFLMVGLLGLSISSCATSYPERRVVQGGDEAALAFSDAPEGAMVLLNGQVVGEAILFDGVAGVLDVPPGRHLVSVILGNTTLYEEQVYVGRNSTLTIDVR